MIFTDREPAAIRFVGVISIIYRELRKAVFFGQGEFGV